jgi:CubicO group peptidase (beta-lactamase class C family)
MARIVIQICLFLLFVEGAYALNKSPLPSEHDGHIDQAIVKFTNVFIAKNKLSQVFELSRNGSVITQKTLGYADVKSRRSLHKNDVFPLFLASSNFTATGILRLQDKNLLDVNDTIDKHLTKKIGIWPNNAIPNWASRVTIQDLLTHSSGIANYSGKITFNNTEKLSASLRSVVQFASSQELSFTPGSKVARSSTNYVLLGLIIEAKSGKSLSKFLEAEFFEPLGMKDTKLVSKYELLGLITGSIGDKYPKNYTPIENPHPNDRDKTTRFLEPTSNIDSSFLAYGDMGIVSNSADLSLWVNALHHGKVLSSASYKKMIRPYFEISYDEYSSQTHLGYGIYISKMENGLVYIHNNSSLGGFDISFGHLPGYNLNLNMLSNISPNATYDMKGKIVQSPMYKYRYVRNPEMIIELFNTISKMCSGCHNKHCDSEAES